MPNKQNQLFSLTMRRFFTLSFLLLTFSLSGQNLIPDPSAEDFVECPSSLGNIDVYTSSWQTFRGSPDYWHSCSENPLLGWNNSVGYQGPRTGEGYLGLVAFHSGLAEGRESFGIELQEPLQVGQTYYLSFYISAAYRPNGFNMTSNNIGCLFMVGNYLDSEGQGELPDYANFHLEDIITDTTNWVNVSYSFVCDSAYNYLSFGNFFSDSLSDTLRLDGEGGNAIAYYYFDDFCLSTEPDFCDVVMNTSSQEKVDIVLYPNPTTQRLSIKSSLRINEIEIYNATGQKQNHYSLKDNNENELELNLSAGIYILKIFSGKKVIKKRFVVQSP